jgi:hypothetical protein
MTIYCYLVLSIDHHVNNIWLANPVIYVLGITKGKH